LIKIKEDLSGKIIIFSSDKEAQQEQMKYPVIIKSQSIQHAFFVMRKEGMIKNDY
jgi:hypothetical protein